MHQIRYVEPSVIHRVQHLYFVRCCIFHTIRWYVWSLENRQFLYHTENVSALASPHSSCSWLRPRQTSIGSCNSYLRLMCCYLMMCSCRTFQNLPRANSNRSHWQGGRTQIVVPPTTTTFWMEWRDLDSSARKRKNKRHLVSIQHRAAKVPNHPWFYHPRP